MIYNGMEIDPAHLFSRQEVLYILKSGGGTDRDLSVIREKYDEKFDKEMICRYPIMVGISLGAVLIPVQEGFLCITYDTMTPEEYEKYDLNNDFLLTADAVATMIRDWKQYTKNLLGAMESIQQILSKE